jgi:outer membrane protein assembly factor BamA
MQVPFRFWLLLCLFPAPGLNAQTVFSVQIQYAPSEQSALLQAIELFRPAPSASTDSTLLFSLPDSLAAAALPANLLLHVQEQSYLSASFDSLSREYKYLHLGPMLRWVSLQPDQPENEAWLNAAGFREKMFQNKALRYDVLLDLEQKILVQAENNGYPFAQVGLAQVRVGENGDASALLRLQRSRFITFSDVKITGDLKVPKAFMRNFLGIQPGAPYSRAQVLRLRDQLRTLPFAELGGNPTVSFIGNEATVNLFLKKKRAGRFDFIIGLLPQPNAENAKLLLTGSLNANFQNALNLGERIALEFERLKPETQRLEASAGVPYLFGTAFGADGKLQIFKRDSSWVDAQGDLGVQYFFPGGDYVRVLWENKSSSLQKVDTLAVIQSRRLPANLDLRQNGFGLEISYARLDYRFNPRKGWSVFLKGTAGFNNVLRNNQIENLRLPSDPAYRFSTLYDSIAGKVARYRAECRLEYYLPFFKRSTLKLAMRSSGIFSPKPVFNNEQFRLGGNKLLRGFDEESLFATRYAVATAEVRLLLGLNSFLSAFTDYGYIENVTYRTRSFLRPVGLGVGMNFETKAGIFGISVAVGRRDVGQGVDFRSAKFHLGYVSLF